jgi:Peptidase family M1 domain
MKNIYLLLFIFTYFHATAQEYKNNPMSWHNRKPNAGYWQQDVHYKIDAKINEIDNSIEATEVLNYTNNSPDALPFVYFHLYQNAFIKDAYLEQLTLANKVQVRHGKQEAQGLGTTVSNITVDAQDCKTELDNTVLKVYLPKVLLPGGTVIVKMNFKTYWDNGTIRRRMQMYPAYGFMHYNAVHWYPRISVYDKKKGWDCDQHLNKELYGDYGIFDVNINCPNNYITEATGALQNKNEVLPAALLQKIQIKNFANKPWGEKPSTIIEYKKGERKTWQYHAENVHDFAFTTDPSYRLSEAEVYGVKCVAIAQESHCAKWQNASDYITKIIKTFSDDFGMYEYPKIVAADANDGMEYPMLTLCGGADPSYRGLLVHEIGHNWFYGMIGNNETYRAALDEGFTQFITAWGLQKIDGNYEVADKNSNKYLEKHKSKMNVWDRSFLYRYTNDASRGDDKTLNTHSNDFNSALAHENGYSNVYHKTASMLLNLQYTLGDSLFLKAMQHYVAKYKFAHPYFEDFREAIIEYTHVDLNWFFDQWMETTKTIDYKIDAVLKKKNNNFKINLSRIGEMQMPLDITVVAKNGIKYNYHIPNTNWFVKNTTATVLPKWYGWDKLNPAYNFEINIPSGINYVQIDTTGRLADADMYNNYRTKTVFRDAGLNTQLDYGVYNAFSRHKQDFYYRPDVWWNPNDGVKIGAHVESSYMGFRRKLNASIWWNSTVLATRNYNGIFNYYNKNIFDYVVSYESPIIAFSKKLSFGLFAKSLDGVHKNSIYSTWKPNTSNTLKLEYTNLSRNINAGNYNYNYENDWSSFTGLGLPTNTFAKNRYVQMNWTNQYKNFKSMGYYKITMRSNLPVNNALAQYNYTYIQGEGVHKNYWKKFDISTRTFWRFGAGNAVPYESSLYLAGANPEEMSENKYTRVAYLNPNTYSTAMPNNFSNIHAGGGLNLRGYNGYIAVDKADSINDVFLNYKGRSGISVSTEIEFDKYIKWYPRFTRNWLHADAYIFADAGGIERSQYNFNNYNNLKIAQGLGFAKLRADAGLGVAFTIKSWGRFEKAEPLTLRIDAPIFLSSIPANYMYNHISLRRWVIGVNKSF